MGDTEPGVGEGARKVTDLPRQEFSVQQYSHAHG